MSGVPMNSLLKLKAVDQDMDGGKKFVTYCRALETPELTELSMRTELWALSAGANEDGVMDIPDSFLSVPVGSNYLREGTSFTAVIPMDIKVACDSEAAEALERLTKAFEKGGPTKSVEIFCVMLDTLSSGIEDAETVLWDAETLQFIGDSFADQLYDAVSRDDGSYRDVLGSFAALLPWLMDPLLPTTMIPTILTIGTHGSGKSSLLAALADKEQSSVFAPTPTWEIKYTILELDHKHGLPFGVVLTDTPGLIPPDAATQQGEPAKIRLDKACKELRFSNMVLGSCDSTRLADSSHGLRLAYELALDNHKDFAVVVTKIDMDESAPAHEVDASIQITLEQVRADRQDKKPLPKVFRTSSETHEGLGDLVKHITEMELLKALGVQ